MTERNTMMTHPPTYPPKSVQAKTKQTQTQNNKHVVWKGNKKKIKWKAAQCLPVCKGIQHNPVEIIKTDLCKTQKHTHTIKFQGKEGFTRFS